MMMIVYLDLIDNTDETFCFDNTSLFDILTKTLRLPSGTYGDINQILAQVMIGITACFRFPGEIELNLRKEILLFRSIKHGST